MVSLCFIYKTDFLFFSAVILHKYFPSFQQNFQISAPLYSVAFLDASVKLGPLQVEKNSFQMHRRNQQAKEEL